MITAILSHLFQMELRNFSGSCLLTFKTLKVILILSTISWKSGCMLPIFPCQYSKQKQWGTGSSARFDFNFIGRTSCVELLIAWETETGYHPSRVSCHIKKENNNNFPWLQKAWMKNCYKTYFLYVIQQSGISIYMCVYECACIRASIWHRL